MRSLVILSYAFLIGLACACTGCSSVPSVLSRGIPDGTWQHVKTTAASAAWGSATIEADGVVKTGTTVTAQNLHVQISNPFQPVLDIQATGYAPAAATAPAVAASPAR